jgi:hypothetical protein
MRYQRALTAGKYSGPKSLLPRLRPSVDLIYASVPGLPPPILDASVNQRCRPTELEDIGSRDLESLDPSKTEFI